MCGVSVCILDVMSVNPRYKCMWCLCVSVIQGCVMSVLISVIQGYVVSLCILYMRVCQMSVCIQDKKKKGVLCVGFLDTS